MKFGIVMFPAHYAIGPAELARAVEERGFESLLFPEHTHIPASRESPWPGGPELPREYSHTFDPFVALMAAAAATTTLKVGTGICLVIERDPIITAKEVASLDVLSGGRFLFGVGAGWNREEMANHGTDPRVRMAVMAERVHAMKAIWSAEEASFHGRYVEFDRIWSWPKPLQQPHPPVLVGGGGPGVLERVLDFGDEWMPNRVADLDLFKKRVRELQAMAADRGRERVPVTVFGGRPRADEVARLAEIGVDRCLFYVKSEGEPEVLRQLDELAALTSP